MAQRGVAEVPTEPDRSRLLEDRDGVTREFPHLVSDLREIAATTVDDTDGPRRDRVRCLR
jgi:hypothetical protein